MYCHDCHGRYEHLNFTTFKKVPICLLNFGILRLNMLQESFEYAWGNFRFYRLTKSKCLKFKVIKR